MSIGLHHKYYLLDCREIPSMGGRAAGIWRPVIPYSEQLYLHTWKEQWATTLSTGANTASF